MRMLAFGTKVDAIDELGWAEISFFYHGLYKYKTFTKFEPSKFVE